MTKWKGKSKAIMIVENALTSKECNSLISLAEQTTDWKKSITVGELKTNQTSDKFRTSQEMTLMQHPKEDQLVFNKFNQALKNYDKKIDIHLSQGIVDEPYRILKYEPEQFYDYHLDMSGLNPRVLSGLIYINDTYKGGELHFPLDELKIQPTKGQLILFPSNFLFKHSSLPIIEGIKYSVVTFFRYKI